MKIRTVVNVALVSALVVLSAQTPEAQGGPSTLTIKVVGAKNAKGTLGVALFQGPTGFPQDIASAIRIEQVDVDPNTLTAETVFANLSPGDYAVAVQHDENLNGELDKGFFGNPTEGYGISNDARSMFRAPRFDEAKFTVARSAQTVEIKLGY